MPFFIVGSQFSNIFYLPPFRNFIHGCLQYTNQTFIEFNRFEDTHLSYEIVKRRQPTRHNKTDLQFC